jgi:hypothetical protein
MRALSRLSWRRHLKTTLGFVALFAAWSMWQRGCDRPLPDIAIDDGIIVVRNQTAEKWTNVRVWVNDYYSGLAREIPAGGFVREPVGRFVAAQGQTLQPSAAITSVVALGTTQSGAHVRVVWGKPFWH